MATMFVPGDGDTCDPQEYARAPSRDRKDIGVQLVLSLILGLTALVTFCVRLSLAVNTDCT